eukprot:jgi/Tetstr1/461823/TSEL_006904.t2
MGSRSTFQQVFVMSWPPTIRMAARDDNGLATNLLADEEEVSLGDEVEAPDEVTIQRLIEEVPENVVGWLSKYGVQKLGELQVTSKVALRFQLYNGIFLTAGMEELDGAAESSGRGADWQKLWREQLEVRGNFSRQGHDIKRLRQPVGPRKQILHGWESQHTMDAFVVTLKHACSRGEAGLMSPLLRRASAGAEDISVFQQKALRAVISFKWRKYARAVALAQLYAYVAWLLLFCGFVCIANWAQCGLEGGEPAAGRWCAISAGCLAASTAVSVPFLIVEVCIMWWYGAGSSLLRRGTIHMCTILGLQYAVLAATLAGVGSLADVELLIAVQLVLMWSRLSCYFRGFKAGAFEPLEMIKRVLWEARAMLLFLAFLVFGFSMAYWTLFRNDDGADDDFASLPHSVVSLIVMCGGLGVNLPPMYASSHAEAAVVFFLVFETLVSIIMINILLAVVVSVFQQAMDLRQCFQLQRRAGLIDEIDALLEIFGIHNPAWTPTYLHILEMKPPQRAVTSSDYARRHMSAYEMFADLKADMRALKTAVAPRKAQDAAQQPAAAIPEAGRQQLSGSPQSSSFAAARSASMDPPEEEEDSVCAWDRQPLGHVLSRVSEVGQEEATEASPENTAPAAAPPPVDRVEHVMRTLGRHASLRARSYSEGWAASPPG